MASCDSSPIRAAGKVRHAASVVIETPNAKAITDLTDFVSSNSLLCPTQNFIYADPREILKRTIRIRFYPDLSAYLDVPRKIWTLNTYSIQCQNPRALFGGPPRVRDNQLVKIGSNKLRPPRLTSIPDSSSFQDGWIQKLLQSQVRRAANAAAQIAEEWMSIDPELSQWEELSQR